ncbi:MAG: hypothetical protein WCJ35_26775, partial [Planctomycetota bacterium]
MRTKRKRVRITPEVVEEMIQKCWRYAKCHATIEVAYREWCNCRGDDGYNVLLWDDESYAESTANVLVLEDSRIRGLRGWVLLQCRIQRPDEDVLIDFLLNENGKIASWGPSSHLYREEIAVLLEEADVQWTPWDLDDNLVLYSATRLIPKGGIAP